MKDKFILTNDFETADKLLKIGLKQVVHNGSSYMFVNTKNINFSADIDIHKIAYTNTLYM